MEAKKLGQEPAFPGDTLELGPGGEFKYHNEGMSKRFYAACMAMNGLTSSATIRDVNEEKISRMAYKIADEMLKQENL